MRSTHPQVKKALEFIREHQEEDGSWYGRWGVNYIYGTWQVLRGLRALNIEHARALAAQGRATGSKACSTRTAAGANVATPTTIPSSKGRARAPPRKPPGPSWACCAFGDPHRPSISRGIEYLTRTQNPDGSWTEHETTGTGFPRVFYLKYDMYRNSWPLLALATYKQLLEQKRASEPSNGHVNGKAIATPIATEVTAI